ncbi:head maturation protease, ClpP-related [Rhodopseudomonas palustris]
MAGKKSWFAAKAAKGRGEITIYSDIGAWGVTAQDFDEAVKRLGEVDQLDVMISSDGGDVFVGFAIYDMLARHPAQKTVRVVGLAASMASVIAMAGDEVVMPSNAMMMIHNPWGGVIGESDQMRTFADLLDTMRENITNAYVKRTGLDAAQVTKLMNAETWLSAERAAELGFADRVDAAVDTKARFNVAKFSKVPKAMRAFTKESTVTDQNEDKAAQAGSKSESEIRAQIVAQQKEVRSLCKLAGHPELADKFVESGASIEAVIAALAEVKDDEAKAKEVASQAELNTRAPVNDSVKGSADINAADIYAKYNRRK